MTKENVRQLDYIFKARSVAVIGASNTPLKWGYMMVSTPLKTGYRGAIYPVNPREENERTAEICVSVARKHLAR